MPWKSCGSLRIWDAQRTMALRLASAEGQHAKSTSTVPTTTSDFIGEVGTHGQGARALSVQMI